MRTLSCQRGSGLAEMMVTMSIVVSSLLAALSLVDVTKRYSRSQDQLVRMNQNLRIAVDQMVRETQLAGSGLYGGQTSGIGTCWLDPEDPLFSQRDTKLSCSVFNTGDGSDRLVLYTDTDGDSFPGSTPDIERITYRREGDLLVREEDSWDPANPDAPGLDSDPPPSPVAENIELLRLEPGSDSVTITLRGQTRGPDAVTKQPRTLELVSTAFVRSEN